MIKIAHRGNISGPSKDENKPEYILQTLEKGCYVEVDVWKIGDNLLLGHDRGEYPVDLDFLKKDRLICHCKNADALELMIKEGIHCFGHDKDDVVLTSRGWLWTYLGKPLTKQSICVMPEISGQDPIDCLGVCSDYLTF